MIENTVVSEREEVDPDDDGLLPELAINVEGFDISNNNNRAGPVENISQRNNQTVSSLFPTWEGKRLFPPPSSRSWSMGDF